ncbi:hypothetical protein CYLTODRAFT_320138, partial [Cylindrobasidium torrendii FP15055 ss-10]
SLTTFNLGPQTVCHGHCDDHDFSCGWSPLRSFGPFDYKKGGHVVLWELGVAFEFPPGTRIFFPSALLTHSNTSIQEDEERYSVTSYSSGGEFQWVGRG